jgi:hypothetical protein
MSISSTGLLTIIVLGSLFCILIKITEINRDQRGITIKTIKCKKKTPSFAGVTIIIVAILLLVTSSGCATKELTTINNINNVSQTASEKTSSVPIISEPAATETSANKATLGEEATPTEEEIQVTPKIKPDIKIIHPVEETNWQENIGGNAKNIPDGYELWILVYSREKEQYYPYTKVIPKYDEWVIKPLVIGFKDDCYKDFDIIAVLADTQAQKIFNDYLNSTEENEENIYSQGIYHIPEGAKEYSRITLTRKSIFNDNTIN